MALMYRADLLERTLAGLYNSLEGGRAAVIVRVEGLVVASQTYEYCFVSPGSG